jgi:hypothetical protein
VVIEENISLGFRIEEGFLFATAFLVEHAVENVHDYVVRETDVLRLRVRYFVARFYHV